MTLWCFGDSYIAPGFDYTNTWTKQIGQYFNCEVKNFGRNASALEYTYVQFDSADIQNNDIVIIVLTDISRKYFFPEYPDVSLITYPESILKKISRPQRVAFRHYSTYLENLKVDETNLRNFLYRVQYVSEKKNLKTVVFKAYVSVNLISNMNLPNVHIVPTCLIDISMGEVKNNDWSLVTKHFEFDPRVNHMSLSNHTILAQRVIGHLVHRTPIVLDHFITDIINEETVIDRSVHRNEFFWSNEHQKLVNEI